MGAVKISPKQLLIPLVVIVLCAAGTWFSLKRAMLPFHVEQNPTGQLQISEQDHIPLPGQLKSGDIVLNCEGHTLDSKKALELITDGQNIGDIVSLQLVREGREFSAHVSLIPFYSIRYQLIAIPFGLVFLILGIIVHWKQPEKKEARYFFFSMLAVSIMYFFPWRPYNIYPTGLAQLFQLIYLSAYAATPILFIKFAFIFPREKRYPFQRYLPVLTLFFSIFVLWLTLSYSLATLNFSFAWYHRFIFWFNGFRVIFSACLLFALSYFVHSYFRAIEEEDRRKLRWILLGLAIGSCAIIFLWTIPQTFLSRGLVPEDIVLLICSVIPITFAISIIRHHLLDIDIIFNRSVVYALIFLCIAAIYTTVIGSLAYFVSTFTVQLSVLSSAVVAVFIAIIFDPLRQKIQEFVDKTFFRVHYNYRDALLRINEDLKNCITIAETGKILLQHVDINILPEFSGFYIYNNDLNKSELLISQNIPPLYSEFDSWFDYQTNISQATVLINPRYTESREGFAVLKSEQNLSPEPALVFTLQDEKKNILGILLLGPKKSGFRYSREDIDLLSVAANQTSQTIERINLQQDLLFKQEVARHLEELSKSKSQFISSVTHELKTPLTSIKMFAELMGNENTALAKAREYSAIIEGEADRLNRLISTVLDFAKMERGTKSFQFHAVDLNKIITGALVPFEYIFKMENFTIKVSLHLSPLIVIADADGLVQIFNNILSNAMKFSASVRELLIETSEKNGFAVMAITDRGIGIDKRELENIFQPFYRARDKKAQRIGGAGLGLQVVKSIVDAHNGRIEVQSQPEKGSTFSLFLPLEQSHETHINN
ncbi:MAG: hypothetical protein DWQ05_05135 [Calditrichaeota bacterium]|nr:MAG: hypothetical protein DWQ05_05135 [Calditrichota bacterium]